MFSGGKRRSELGKNGLISTKAYPYLEKKRFFGLVDTKGSKTNNEDFLFSYLMLGYISPIAIFSCPRAWKKFLINLSFESHTPI